MKFNLFSIYIWINISFQINLIKILYSKNSNFIAYILINKIEALLGLNIVFFFENLGHSYIFRHKYTYILNKCSHPASPLAVFCELKNYLK